MTKFASSEFGEYLDFPMPPGCTAVIVCVDLQQHVPVVMLLHRQVYRERLRKLLLQYPNARSITVVPHNSDHKITVVPKDILGDRGGDQ